MLMIRIGKLLRTRYKGWRTFSLVLLMMVFLLGGCGLTASDIPGSMPAAAISGNMTLYWGPQVKQRALKMINASTSFCHFSVYELGDKDVLHALVAAKQRGVDVEVVVDGTESQSQSVAVPYLKQAGVQIRSLTIPGGISHIKLLVVNTKDGLEALMGGMNFGRESLFNHDASVFLMQATTAFEEVFQRDYQDAGGIFEEAPVYRSPLVVDRQIAPAMLAAIAKAQKNIEIEAFALTSRPFIQALLAAKSRGVVVKVVLDPHASYQKKTAYELLQAGIDTCFYRPLQDELLHAKIMSIDDGNLFFIGSSNFSRQAFDINHEGDMELLHVATFGQRVDQDMQHMFAQSGAIA